MDEKSTLQEPERTTSTARTPSWEAAFVAQLTDDLADKIAAFARRRAMWIERKRGTADPNLASELYQDALADTWAGTVAWDPKKAPLELHLKRVIRSRTRHELERIERYPSESIESMTTEREHEVSEAIACQRGVHNGIDLGCVVDEVIRELHGVAKDDEEVVQLLGCYGRGRVERWEVMRDLDITASAYHNAHRRFKRLIEQLPAELRTNAITLMV